MATTTNYGWSTPDDTSLVKDGASAIRTLGSAIDTTTKNLNPSTTLGDIEYRSSTANTNTRLGIGTSGQVLTVSGGVPAWTTISSGGMTSIASGSLSTATTSITSIPGTYKNLQLVLTNVSVTSAGVLRFRVNGGGTDYRFIFDRLQNTTASVQSGTGQGYVNLESDFGTAQTTTHLIIDFFDYASSSVNVGAFNGYLIDNSSNKTLIEGVWANTGTTGAITSIDVNTSAGTFDNGTYILYGVS